MNTINSVASSVGDWFSENWQSFAIIIISIVITYIAYKLITRYLDGLRKKERIGQNATFLWKRIVKWISVFVIIGTMISQLNIDLTFAAAILAAAGGTIIGFASINTIGNAIAGIIIMTSRPFKIGDRVSKDGKFADVVAVELIYTRLKTLDNVMVSVPNQELLKTSIENFGKRTVVRRHCSVSVGYEEAPEEVERVLLVASGKVEGVLKEPKPYVWLTKMDNYAAEYTLYVFTNQIMRIDKFDADLNRTVFDMCNENGLDLRTPAIQKIREP